MLRQRQGKKGARTQGKTRAMRRACATNNVNCRHLSSTWQLTMHHPSPSFSRSLFSARPPSLFHLPLSSHHSPTNSRHRVLPTSHSKATTHDREKEAPTSNSSPAIKANRREASWKGEGREEEIHSSMTSRIRDHDHDGDRKKANETNMDKIMEQRRKGWPQLTSTNILTSARSNFSFSVKCNKN